MLYVNKCYTAQKIRTIPPSMLLPGWNPKDFWDVAASKCAIPEPREYSLDMIEQISDVININYRGLQETVSMVDSMVALLLVYMRIGSNPLSLGYVASYVR